MKTSTVLNAAYRSRTWREALEIKLGLPSKQGTKALRLLALLFTVSIAFVLMKAAQNGIFLGVFPRSMIPWAFVASAITLATVSSVAMSATAVLGSARIAQIALATTILFLVALRLLLSVQDKWVAFLAYVCIETSVGVLLIHTWSTISSAMDTRSIRKVLPIAGSGAALAWLIGGLTVTSLVRALHGPAGLLPLAVGVLLVALTILSLVIRWDTDKHLLNLRRHRSLLEGWRSGWNFVKTDNVMRITALLSVLALTAEQLMDFLFLSSVNLHLRTSTAISSFFGLFYAITSGVTLLVLLIASSSLLAKLGARRTLVSILITTVFTAITVMVAPTLLATAVLRGLDRVLKGSLWTSATEQLQLPVDPYRRAQGRSVIRGVVAPLGYASIALVFAVFPQLLQLRFLAFLTVFVVGLMAFLVQTAIRKNLSEGLYRSINERKLSLDSTVGLANSELEISSQSTQGSRHEERLLMLERARELLETPGKELCEVTIANLCDERIGSAMAKLVIDQQAKLHSLPELSLEALLQHANRTVRRQITKTLGKAIVQGYDRLPPKDFVVKLIRQEVETAAKLTSILAGIALNDGVADWEVEPEYAFLAHEIELRIEASRQQILALLLLLGERKLVTTVEVGRRRSSRSRNAQIAELLEMELEPSIGKLIVPLYEQLSLRERVESIRRQGLLHHDTLGDPQRALLSCDDEHLRRCAMLTYQLPVEPELQSERPSLMETLERAKQLRKFDLFADLPAEDLMQIAEVVETVQFRSGQTIFTKGDAGEELYLIVQGEVKITDGAVEIATAKSGEFFGDLSVIDQQPRSASAVCTEASTLLRLRSADLDELMLVRPNIAMHFLKVLAGRLRNVTKRISS